MRDMHLAQRNAGETSALAAHLISLSGVVVASCWATASKSLCLLRLEIWK